MGPARCARFAGLFYPAGRSECIRSLEGFLDQRAVKGAIGGLIPHAGWTYSGPTAGHTIAALRTGAPETVVVFGAVHVRDHNRASLYASGSWDTPLGPVQVDEELARAFGEIPGVRLDPAAHTDEHSIEVELPFIRFAFPDVQIVPLMIRPGPWAVGIGAACVAAAAAVERRVVYLASTDLTHYGPRFGFEPAGRGELGIRWARDVNDRRFIEVVTRLGAKDTVPEAERHFNACGSGAVAATIAAVQAGGASAYIELDHTCSAEREGGDWSHVTDSVGYHAGVFVTPPK